MQRNPMHDAKPHTRTCGAKTRKGTPCKNTAVMPNGRCRMHGGKSPVGAGSPAFKDGSRSKFAAVFAGDDLKHYEFARRDERYLELHEDIAALDTLIMQELRAAKVGQGGALWTELGEVWRRFQEAQPAKDATTAGRCLRRMGEIIGEGAGRHAAQDQALDIFERKRKFTETERKRVLDEQQMISAARVMAFVGALMAIIRKHETDREVLGAIHADVARLVHTDVSGSGAGALSALGG